MLIFLKLEKQKKKKKLAIEGYVYIIHKTCFTFV